jgi:hypothetical protein
MTAVRSEDLRALVREVVRDAVAGIRPPAPSPRPTPAAPTTVADQIGVTPTGPLTNGERNRTETVRLNGDNDLDAFVRKLLALFENPKSRTDLRTGRLRFRLAGVASAQVAAPASHRIDKGVVTERHVAEIATSGGTLLLGPRAVVTPLAREKARALGISIEKERK